MREYVPKQVPELIQNGIPMASKTVLTTLNSFLTLCVKWAALIFVFRGDLSNKCSKVLALVWLHRKNLEVAKSEMNAAEFVGHQIFETWYPFKSNGRNLNLKLGKPIKLQGIIS